jgi:hypothetical protein
MSHKQAKRERGAVAPLQAKFRRDEGRESRGAQFRNVRKKGNYYNGDASTQRKLLEGAIGKINAERSAALGAEIVAIDVERAVLAMYRRVAKFYGLRNKYPSGKKEHNR